MGMAEAKAGDGSTGLSACKGESERTRSGLPEKLFKLCFVNDLEAEGAGFVEF